MVLSGDGAFRTLLLSAPLSPRFFLGRRFLGHRFLGLRFLGRRFLDTRQLMVPRSIPTSPNLNDANFRTFIQKFDFAKFHTGVISV